MISGVVLVNKPIGVSSQYVVTGTKWAFGAKKAGHTGTLDVLASGMLPICLGEATKFSRFALNQCKYYTARVKLGQQTTTGDLEGEVEHEGPTEHIDQMLLEKALESFVGASEQIPPMYSAIKHQGKPLYQLARQSQVVVRAARPIEVYKLELLEVNLPWFTCGVHCSKGTYIRTLFEDVAKAMETYGHLVALHRDWVGGFEQYDMCDFAMLKENPAAFSKQILPFDILASEYCTYRLTLAQCSSLRYGLTVSMAGVADQECVRIMAPCGQMIGIGQILDGSLRGTRLLSNEAFLGILGQKKS